jgi:hypothetical protein
MNSEVDVFFLPQLFQQRFGQLPWQPQLSGDPASGHGRVAEHEPQNDAFEQGVGDAGVLECQWLAGDERVGIGGFLSRGCGIAQNHVDPLEQVFE